MNLTKWHLLLLCLLCSFVLSSCRTTKTNTEERVSIKEVPVTIEKVMRDTLRIVNERIDSIYLHDSIWQERYMQADTVYITKNVYKTEYRDRMVYKDTGSVRFDSVEVPVYVHDTLTTTKVETKTEYKTPTITKGLAAVGGLAIVGLIAYVVARVKS